MLSHAQFMYRIGQKRVATTLTCGYCEQPVKASFVLPDDAEPAESFCDWLDFAVAAVRCPCLGDVLFNVGHRGTRRRLTREALGGLEALLAEVPFLKGEYEARLIALRKTLADLQPRRS